MNEIGLTLRHAREAKGLSIDDVAVATRLNKKYLKALEEGEPIHLPDLYITAFIKDYSQFLGIDVVNAQAPVSPEPGAKQDVPPFKPTVQQQSYAGSAAMRYPQILKPKRSHQFRILMMFTIIVLTAFVGLIFWMRNDSSGPAVEEVKFSEVVKQWDQKKPDTSASPFISGDSNDSTFQRDSLILEGAAVESVWVRVVIDGAEIKEYVLPPLARIRCEGQQFFELSMDNARGISLTLNGKKIGTLSQMKKPMWNVTVSKSTLEKLQKMASGKG